MANYVLLERIELNASAASVTFSNIPQTGYTDLKIVVSARTDRTAAISDGLLMKFNGSSTSYTDRYLQGAGSGTPGSGTSPFGTTRIYTGEMDTNGATSNTFSNQEIYIPNYTSSNFKSVSMDAVMENNATTAYATLTAGLWSNTAAITSIEFSFANSTNFVLGSTFSLYGIANASTTPAIAPKASGGNVIATDGTYWYHTFLTNGTFTPAVGLSCDYLVVAGGGGGGYDVGSGGGGGGYLTGSSSLSASAYTVTIGAGGTAGTSNSSVAGQGVNSSLGAFIATGGGGGAPGAIDTGGAGGSGGGGNVTGGTATSGQGYAGGSGIGGGNGYGRPGGGGASQIGYTGQSNAGGAGGNGTASSIDGTSTTRAGGGGGGLYGGAGATGAGGAGGTGGGGAGSKNGTGSAGTINTGGGGGGGGNSGSGGQNGGAGGSGIVIIRYAVA